MHEPQSKEQSITSAIVIKELRLNLIDPDDRFRLREEVLPNIETLAESIEMNGQTTPIFVTSKAGGRYALVSGYRRYAAIRKLGRTVVLARLFENLSEKEILDIAISENAQRNDMTDWEKIQLCLRLESMGESTAKIAERFGWTERNAQIHIALGNTSTESMKDALRSGRLSITHARLFVEKVLMKPEISVHQEGILRDLCEEAWSVRELARRVEAIERAAQREKIGKKPSFSRDVSEAGCLSFRVSYKPGLHDFEQAYRATRETLAEMVRMRREYIAARRSKVTAELSEREREITERQQAEIERAKTKAEEARRAARVAKELALREAKPEGSRGTPEEPGEL